VDNAYTSIHDAVSDLDKAMKAIRDFVNNAPNFRTQLSAIAAVKVEWKNLARKHGTNIVKILLVL